MKSRFSRIKIFVTLLFISSLSGYTISLKSQTHFTLNSGKISFFSSAPIEDITASVTHFSSDINFTDSTVVFTVPIDGFKFRKALMQQHFNEQYMESSKFPTATFYGKLVDVFFAGDNQPKVLKTRIKGEIVIRGIHKPLDEEVIMARDGDNVKGLCKFRVRLTDFNIKVPRMLIKNIAEVVDVIVEANYNKSDN